MDTSVPTAFITAFITAGGAAIAPASPHPFTPKGFEVAFVHVKPKLNSGKFCRKSAKSFQNF